MYTQSNIWAARVERDSAGKMQLYYFSTRGNDIKKMPRTLAGWKLRYLDQ